MFHQYLSLQSILSKRFHQGLELYQVYNSTYRVIPLCLCLLLSRLVHSHDHNLFLGPYLFRRLATEWSVVHHQQHGQAPVVLLQLPYYQLPIHESQIR